MSTCFLFTKDITEVQLRDAMKACNVEEIVTDDTTPNRICLFDGISGYVWAYINDDRLVGNITKYGCNNDNHVYRIAHKLGTGLLSEHDDGFDELLESKSSDTGLFTIGFG